MKIGAFLFKLIISSIVAYFLFLVYITINFNYSFKQMENEWHKWFVKKEFIGHIDNISNYESCYGGISLKTTDTLITVGVNFCNDNKTLLNFIEEGDSMMKLQYSDSIRILKNNIERTFKIPF